MSEQKTIAKQRLKAWMQSHARKNELIHDVMSEMEGTENKIEIILNKIKDHQNEIKKLSPPKRK